MNLLCGEGDSALSELLTVAQVAARLGFEPDAIYRAIRRGDLLAHKLCGRIRVSEAAVAAFVAAGEVAPAGVAPGRRAVVAVSPSRSYPDAGSFRDRLRAREQR